MKAFSMEPLTEMRQLRKLILTKYHYLDYSPLRGEKYYSHLIVGILGPWRTLKTTLLVLMSKLVGATQGKSSCAPLNLMFMQNFISQHPAFSISDFSFAFINQSPSLNIIMVHICLAGLSALTFLDVSAAYPIGLDDGSLQHICSLAQLQSLSLAYRIFTPHAASSLSLLTCLSVLSIVGCCVDCCLQHLCTHPLTYLYIGKSCESSRSDLSRACLKTKMAICRASLTRGFPTASLWKTSNHSNVIDLS